MRFDVLCRSLALSRAFHLPVQLASPPPKGQRCEHQLARAAHPAHRLGHTKLTTQVAFDWFDPDFSARRSRASFRQYLLSASRPGHHLCGTQLPALPKVIRSPKPAIRRSASPSHNPKGLRPKEPLVRKDASPQSLQLTCCHGHPPNASTPELQAYAFLTSPSRRKPLAHTNAWVRNLQPSRAALARRKRHPQPRATTQ
jgi:hypothetical protein